MEKARMLELSEATEYNRKVIWLELIGMDGALPVTYHSERYPFLRYDCETLIAMIEVRGEYYGETWRCWSAEPEKRAAAKGDRKKVKHENRT